MIMFTHLDVLQKLTEMAVCDDCDDYVFEGVCKHTAADDAIALVKAAVLALEKEINNGS